MRRKRLFYAAIWAGVVLYCCSGGAFAETVILDKIDADFKGLQAQWFGVIVGYAWRLFWLLATIDVAWSAITWVMERKEFGELCVAFMRKSFVIGFFALLLQMANAWIPAIIESFAQIGKAACGGNCSALTPDGIFVFGLQLASDLIRQLLNLDLGQKLVMAFPLGIACILICLAFALIAGQLLITLIESYIAIGAGVIMLGFGGSRWTSDLSSSYLKFAVGTGVKVMMSYLVVGAGLALFQKMPDMVNATTAQGLLSGALILSAEAIVFVFMAWNIPSLAAGMLSGAPSSTLGGFMASATTAGAAVAGGVAATGSFAKGALTNTLGAAEALKAGYASSLDSGMSRGAAAMSAFPKAIMGMGKTLASGSAAGLNQDVGRTLGGRAAAGMATSSSGNTFFPERPNGESAAPTGQNRPTGTEQETHDGQPSVNTREENREIPGRSVSSSEAIAVESPKAQSNPVSPGQSVSPASTASFSSGSSGMGFSGTSGTNHSSFISGSSSSRPAAFASASASASGISNKAMPTSREKIDASFSGMGNAVGASLNSASMPVGREERQEFSRSLADVIKEMDKFIPQDGASVQTGPINLSHGKD